MNVPGNKRALKTAITFITALSRFVWATMISCCSNMLVWYSMILSWLFDVSCLWLCASWFHAFSLSASRMDT
jgi:hypothetical protein